MAFKLVVSDTIVVPVEGTLTNPSTGVSEPFKFELLCTPATTTEARADDKSSLNLVDKMLAVTSNWRYVQDAGGAAVNFSEETFRQLLERPGMPLLCFTSRLSASGVEGKQKNFR